MVTLDLNPSTIVQAGGANFSHGQRQVLSLVRALVRESPLVLLDEATASVDGATEKGIRDLLRMQLGTKSLIAVAHRLRTIIDFDRVVVIDSGRIVEMGEPRSLFAKRGVLNDMVMHGGDAWLIHEMSRIR